jgi:TRAP-type C4-dicarboxylate transport system substrate-binding protein
MNKFRSLKIWIVCVATLASVSIGSLVCGMGDEAQAGEITFKVALYTPPTHIRNEMVRTFLKQFEKATDGKVVAELFESGQLSGARDEPKAVARGDIDFVVASHAAISRFVPTTDIVNLPMFSGLSLEAVNSIVDSEIGREINNRVAEKLDVVAIGRWQLLGQLNTYSTKKPIRSVDDFYGMKIRVPGSANMVAHCRALGATATPIPFGDVPMALTQNTIDALLTTDESISSAKLVEAGIRFGFIDHAAIGYYIPLASKKFWKRLNPDQQKSFKDIWDSLIDEQRDAAAKSQLASRKKNEEDGVSYTYPSREVVMAMREKLIKVQPELVEKLKIDSKLVQIASKKIAKLQ